MNVTQFKYIKKLDNLIPCRKIAYESASDLKVVLWNDKFWDLFALYNNQWHYLSTIKNS